MGSRTPKKQSTLSVLLILVVLCSLCGTFRQQAWVTTTPYMSNVFGRTIVYTELSRFRPPTSRQAGTRLLSKNTATINKAPKSPPFPKLGSDTGQVVSTAIVIETTAKTTEQSIVPSKLI